ncbi:MAG: Crp/Fnr family transcriptional regulator [Rhodospirillales bacterium]|nr:Crp/Fnr family transcriptional regulator [Rhodospirillales bacterium]
MTPQELLRLHPFFDALTARDARELLMRARSRRVAAGQVIFQQGAPGDGLYGVLSGRVTFTVDTADGRGLILNVLGPGEFFGEIALLDGKGRTATAVARDPGRLLFIARNEFMSFFGKRPEAMSHIIALLCARLRRSTDYIADATFLDLSRRLARQLVALANGSDTSGAAALRISHAELAAMLGVSRERVSKQLAAWSERGILDQGRGRLVVRDRRALAAEGGGCPG